jgi:antitoxin MazE
MITRVRRWGNSLGVRIPRALATAARVEEGGEVELAVRAGRLTIRRVGPPRTKPVDLRTLLKGVTRKNLHREVDDGAPVGRELL